MWVTLIYQVNTILYFVSTLLFALIEPTQIVNSNYSITFLIKYVHYLNNPNFFNKQNQTKKSLSHSYNGTIK